MENIILTLDNGKKKEFVKGIKLKEVIKTLKEEYPNDIIIAKYNNNIINYEDTITKNGTLSLYDINTKQGNKVYEKLEKTIYYSHIVIVIVVMYIDYINMYLKLNLLRKVFQ